MSTPWLVIIAILTVAALFVLIPIVTHTFLRFRSAKHLRCPETAAAAEVGVDASRAAFSAAFGQPRLRVTHCSLWPERQDCAQACLNHEA
ncbi:MAG: hypothetical protein V3U42_10465 [candidate division NC10 bacterium]|jgi:hypothetical protein